MALAWARLRKKNRFGKLIRGRQLLTSAFELQKGSPYVLIVATEANAVGFELQNLSLKQVQQQALRNGIVAVILLQNLQATAARVTKDHGVRLHVRGDVAEHHVVDTRLQL